MAGRTVFIALAGIAVHSNTETEAASRIPDSLIQKVALVGPAAKIAEELPIWKNALLTSMLISGDPRSLRIMADLTN